MTPEQSDLLRKPFPAKSIGKLPKGGAQLSFVGHATTTDRLLSVDPGWSWEPVAYDESGLPAYDRAGGLWIKLTICGVTRLGYGDGPDPKQRIGDAIRNGAMRFGVALDLWSAQELERLDPNGGDAAAPVRTAQDWHAKHDEPQPPKKAERSKGQPPQEDPWAAHPVAKVPATVDAWITDWMSRLADATTKDALAELWKEGKAQVAAGDCTPADWADLEIQWTQAKNGWEAIAAATAEANAEPIGHLSPEEAAAPEATQEALV